ncbi:hypothetical protein C8J57DRAFT_1219220 [Mycena rebaudengoi]|nr:hypothetical protein C8J57DRAFT_1219220 [Mycena rebaudengoi]
MAALPEALRIPDGPEKLSLPSRTLSVSSLVKLQLLLQRKSTVFANPTDYLSEFSPTVTTFDVMEIPVLPSAVVKDLSGSLRPAGNTRRPNDTRGEQDHGMHSRRGTTSYDMRASGKKTDSVSKRRMRRTTKPKNPVQKPRTQQWEQELVRETGAQWGSLCMRVTSTRVKRVGEM